MFTKKRKILNREDRPATRIRLGNPDVGILGILYFDSNKEAEEFGEDESFFLESLRCKSDDYKKIFKKYRKERIIYNFLRELKYRVEHEDENVNVWAKEFEWGEKVQMPVNLDTPIEAEPVQEEENETTESDSN